MTASSERLRRLLAVDLPLVQAPMAGGTSTPALAAAVANAGALGSLGCAYLTPEAIARQIDETRALTRKPFAVNLFAIGAPPDAGDGGRIAAVLEALAPYYAELAVEPPREVAGPPAFAEQLAAVLQARPAVFSFTFGLPSPAEIAALKDAGIIVIGTATTVPEARALEAAGVDAIVAQGAEAGGHRGTFIGSFEEAMLGTLALVPQVVDAVRVPVLAAGGIMDGRGITAAMSLGASGVQLGTAFIPCPESGAPAAHKRAILEAGAAPTAVTRAFSGRPARGLINRFMREFAAEALPYPLQNALTSPLRRAAARAGQPDLLALWAGQGVALARELPAAELVRNLALEAEWL